MVFRSAIDWWFWAILVSTAVVLVAAAIPVVRTGSTALSLSLAIAALCTIGLPLWLATSTYYKVGNDTLRVKSGPFSWNINRDSIKSVSPSRSLVSSPALSLDRLEIKYGNDQTLLVSPRNRQAFIDAIAPREEK